LTNQIDCNPKITLYTILVSLFLLQWRLQGTMDAFISKLNWSLSSTFSSGGRPLGLSPVQRPTLQNSSRAKRIESRWPSLLCIPYWFVSSIFLPSSWIENSLVLARRM